VRWAEQQIKELIPLCNSFLKQYPHTFGIESDSNGNWRVVVRSREPTPADIPLLAGDIVHNLKSAADYCWMGLYRSIDPRTVEKLTMPRGDRWEEVKGKVTQAAENLGLPNIVEFVLDAVQPYNVPPPIGREPREDGNRPLWLLGKLDNWNKHNLLITSVVATFIRRAVVGTESGWGIDNVLISDTRVTGGGAGVFAIELPPGERLIFKNEPDITIEIIVRTGKPGEEGSLVPLLGAMFQQTAKIVKLFHATFAKNPLRQLR
jgi:hypothetical protein